MRADRSRSRLRGRATGAWKRAAWRSSVGWQFEAAFDHYFTRRASVAGTARVARMRRLLGTTNSAPKLKPSWLPCFARARSARCLVTQATREQHFVAVAFPP